MPPALPVLLQGDLRHPDGHTLLALARRQGVLPDVDGRLLPPAGQPFLLLAHGSHCLPALARWRGNALCRAALLLQPAGDALAASPLPFPALVACHRPDAHSVRLTQAASLAAVWQARFHLLQGRDALAELSPLLAALRQLATQPQFGEC